MKDKFLTVFAVFDNNTQTKLLNLQKKILEKVKSKGRQTMDIPFHITLGSFPTNEELLLCEKIENVCHLNCVFDVALDKISFFNNGVVFVEPIVNDDLIKLHEEFDCNYANGFEWHAHSTLYIDDNEENINVAKQVAIENFDRFTARITGIELGEFFPTRMIKCCEFNNASKKEQK